MLPCSPWVRGLVVVLLGPMLVVPAHGQIPEEYALKAAFVFRFAQFVDWPDAALQEKPRIEFCVWPPNPFGDVLGELLEGETLQGRPLVLRQLTPAASLSTCQVLFLHGPSTEAVLKRVGQQPILTVGDGPRFLEQGGIIELIRADNRLQFNISLEAAERAGLRFSSRLLELAANLRRSGP